MFFNLIIDEVSFHIVITRNFILFSLKASFKFSLSILLKMCHSNVSLTHLRFSLGIIAKIICLSVAFVMENGDIKKQTFSGNNEKELLVQVRNLLDRCHKLDFYLCGHNLKNFDIPMLAKRMIINGIMPSKILPSYDTKPWEVKAIDTKEIWQYGAYSSIGSLDLMCSCLEIPTPKDGEVTGDKVHETYWEKQDLKSISEYCEKDVIVLVDTIKKLKNLQ